MQHRHATLKLLLRLRTTRDRKIHLAELLCRFLLRYSSGSGEKCKNSQQHKRSHRFHRSLPFFIQPRDLQPFDFRSFGFCSEPALSLSKGQVFGLLIARARIQKWNQESFIRYFSASHSEEHTSELQSLRHLVCRLLLEKKK